MSFIDKLKFWKKDEFDFDKDFGKDMGMQGMGNMPDLGMPHPQEITQPPQEMPQHPQQFAQPESVQQFKAEPHMKYMDEAQSRPESKPDYGKSEMEVISVKIDNLRTLMEVLNQRLQRIEDSIEKMKKSW